MLTIPNVTKQMSCIRKRFEESLQEVVKSNLVGNVNKQRWELQPQKKSVLQKLRLVLSWKMGCRAIKLTPKQLLFHFIEEYKALDPSGFMLKKYGK